MKKLFTLLVTTLCVLATWAHDFKVDDIYYNIINDNEVEVTYRGKYPFTYTHDYKDTVVVPSVVTYKKNSYTVKRIGEDAFAWSEKLTRVTLPNTVTSIGEDAFMYCRGLISIVMSDKVTNLGKEAFWCCESLTTIDIPDRVSSVGDSTFYSCYKLQSVTIGKDVRSISGTAFTKCSSLRSITWNAKSYPDFSQVSNDPFPKYRSQITSFIIGDGVERIPSNLCYGMSRLTTMVIPNSVTSIGDSAFDSCFGLTSMIIPSSVSGIGDYAFRNCSSLTSMTIPNGVKNIGKSIFVNCKSLTSITWNAKMCRDFSNLDSSPLHNLRSQITSLTIGNDVEHIPAYLCHELYKLNSLTIGDRVNTIGEYAFNDCIGLTSVSIPSSVIHIGNFAFANCIGITSITIPYGLTSIGYCVFDGCSALNSIVWNARCCKNFPKVTYVPFYSISSQISSFVIGDGVEHLPSYLCSGMSKLTTVTIPNSVVSVGDEIFSNCDGIRSVAISNRLKDVGFGMFAYCSELTSVTIPNSVTNVDDYAFIGCSNLSSIDIPYGVTRIGKEAFRDCALASVSLPSSVKECGTAAFMGCESLTDITLSENMTHINNQMFYGCSSLLSLVLPESTSSVGSQAFAYCTSLASIHQTGRILRMEEDALVNCSATVYYQFKSPDLQMELARGNVSSIKYNDCKILDYSYEGWYDVSEGCRVERNDKNQLVYFSNGYEGCEMILYEWSYNDKGYIDVESSFLCECERETKYIYNDSNELVRMEISGDNLGDVFIEKYTFTNYQYDSHGNWISRDVRWEMKPDVDSEAYKEDPKFYNEYYKENKAYTETRIITYYD